MSGIIYIYMILLIASILELFNKSLLIKKFLWLVSCGMFLFVIGLGYKVGVDWVSYQDEYLDKVDVENFEIFYRFLTEFISKYIGFWLFAISVKIIYCTLVIWIIGSLSKFPITTLTMFFGMSYAFVNDPLRQLLAASLFLFACITLKSYPKFFHILLSSGFHSSALILFFGKVNAFKTHSNKNLFIALILGLILASMLRSSLILNYLGVLTSAASDKIIFYSSQFQFANIFSNIMRISIFSIGIYLANKYYNLKDKKNLYVYQLAFLMLFVEVASLGFPILGQRVRLYLLPFALIILTNGLQNTYIITRLFLVVIIEIYIGTSLFFFLNGKMSPYYILDMNIFLQYMKGFPINNWESNAYSFWLTN